MSRPEEDIRERETIPTNLNDTYALASQLEIEEQGPGHSKMSAMTTTWEGKINPYGRTRPFHKKPPFAKRKIEEITSNFSKPKMKESQGSSSKKVRR